MNRPKAAPRSCQGGCGCGEKGRKVFNLAIPHPGHADCGRGHDCCGHEGYGHKENNVYFHGPAMGGAHGKTHAHALPHGKHAEIICEDGDGECRVIVVRPGQEIEKFIWHDEGHDSHSECHGECHEHEHDGLP